MVASVNDNDPVLHFSSSNHQRAAVKCDDSEELEQGCPKYGLRADCGLVSQNPVVRHPVLDQASRRSNFSVRLVMGSASAQLRGDLWSRKAGCRVGTAQAELT